MREPKDVRAFHEAGHAVMAMSLGIKFRYVTIRESESDGGHIRFYNACIWRTISPQRVKKLIQRTKLRMEQIVQRTIAGGVAEMIYKGTPISVGDLSNLFLSASDIRLIRDAVGVLWPESSSDTRCAWFSWMFLRIRDDLLKTWPLVEAVAAALMERETLTYQEVVEVCSHAPVAKPSAQPTSPRRPECR